jgi:hypothetical protein
MDMMGTSTQKQQGNNVFDVKAYTSHVAHVYVSCQVAPAHLQCAFNE